ncbi:hypothetical protein V8C42DRAFT_338174 [Trichoderma barbatum]
MYSIKVLSLVSFLPTALAATCYNQGGASGLSKDNYWTARENYCGNTGNGPPYWFGAYLIDLGGNGPDCWDATENIINQCWSTGGGHWDLGSEHFFIQGHGA